jgi:Ca-activated chloride channel homolog
MLVDVNMRMVPLAHRVRTSLLLGAAGATIVAALLLHARPTPPPTTDERADDGMRLGARTMSTRIPIGAHDESLAVLIGAPAAAPASRPPVSIAIVIDRSPSMADSESGTPFSNAKAAAARLVDKLDTRDAFAIVAYANSDVTVAPMTAATPEAKRAAVAAIAALGTSTGDDNGTCIACGLMRGTGELARTPVTGGVRRVVIISDGQANTTTSHALADVGFAKDEAIRFAHDAAAHGISVSSVGVGLGFDEITMIKLADVGHGNYYFVEDTRDLDTMFGSELESAAGTIATDVRLTVGDAPGVHIEEAYGYSLTRIGDRVEIPIADLRAGETRKVVLRVRVSPARLGAFAVSDQIELAWKRVSDGAPRLATTSAWVEVVDDATAVAATVDRPTVEIVEQALSAKALEEATVAYDKYGSQAAQAVIQYRVNAVHANRYLEPAAVERIDQAHNAAIGSFAAAPSGGDAGEKAKKVTRGAAFQLAR